MISDILNYHLKRKHDSVVIWEQLIKEEELYIGKVRYVGRKIAKHLRHHKGDLQETFRRIQDSEGIPDIILQQSESLKFK